jgi:hypothetical protein
MYCVCNGILSTSDYTRITLNYIMINDNELERMWNEMFVVKFKHSSGTFLVGLRKLVKIKVKLSLKTKLNSMV